MTGRCSVVRPGLLTTVQDDGRWGWQSLGVPVAGAMDSVSHRLANALVGNQRWHATLEITLQGPTLAFHDERFVAVCGAAFELFVDDHAVGDALPLRMSPGSQLRCAARSQGARAYLAISGGIEVPEILGSRSTHLASTTGGLQGRALKAGDTLPLGVGSSPSAVRPAAGWHDLVRLPGRSPVPVRILPGPDIVSAASEGLKAIASSPFVVTAAADRMGYRLSGPRIHVVDSGSRLSEGTVQGAIQVPADGDPILLTSDRQTTGGYPVLGVVIAADLGLVGQMAPGDRLSFVVCSRQGAADALLAQERRLMAFETARSA